MLLFLNKIFSEIKKIYPKNIFKIVYINGTPIEKNLEIAYQVRGKSTIATEKPEILIRELIYGFSKNDADLLLNLLIEEKFSASLRIKSVVFEQELVLFEIKDVISQYNFFLTSEEIVSSNNILNKFSMDDVIKVYFQLMKEMRSNEDKEKKQLLSNQHEQSKFHNIYSLKYPETST